MSSIWDNHGLDSNHGIKVLVNKFNSMKKNADLLSENRRQNRSLKKDGSHSHLPRNKKASHV